MRGARLRSHWRSACAYFIAALLVVYSARGIHLSGAIRALRAAELRLFIPVSLAGFLIWFFGETLLFARLFSYFHKRTGFRELIPANAAYYFLQLTNLAIASGALIFFLNRRKGVAWNAAGFTLLFQGLIDLVLLAAMTLAAVLLGLDSPLRAIGPYAAGIVLAGVATAGWFLWRRDASGPAQWLYERPALSTFRSARLSHYVRLSLIRLPIFLAEGFVLYGELRSFHVNISLFQALLFSPVSLLAGSLPLAPVGLGALQLVLVKGLAGVAPKSVLLTSGLAISFVNFVWRIPLGLLSAGSLAGVQIPAESSCAAVRL